MASQASVVTAGDLDGAVRRTAPRGWTRWLNVAVSVAALLASVVSLWESTLKRPDLKVYVTDSIYYTRDPWGGYEVVAVPVTIQNSGARDDAVIALQLDVRTSAGATERFLSTYTVDAQYFGSSDDVGSGRRRPKQPFAPLSVAGRGAYTGTILFYTRDYQQQPLLEPKSQTELTLRAVTPEPSGFLDRLLQRTPAVIRLQAEVPNYQVGILLSGDIVRLKSRDAAAP